MLPSTLEEFERLKLSGNFANLVDIEKKKPGDLITEIKDPYLIWPVTLVRLKQNFATIQFKNIDNAIESKEIWTRDLVPSE